MLLYIDLSIEPSQPHWMSVVVCGEGQVKSNGFVTRGQSIFVPVGVLGFLSPSLSGPVFPGRSLLVEVEVCYILPLRRMSVYPTRRVTF